MSMVWNYDRISNNIPMVILGIVFLMWGALYFDEEYEKAKVI